MNRKLRELLEGPFQLRLVYKSGGPINNDFKDANRWMVTIIQGQNRRLGPFPFYTGRAISHPELDDVLYAVISDTLGYENAHSFEEWCGEYGYDVDSRKAESVWYKVEEQASRVREFFGRDVERIEGILRESGY